MSDAVKVLVCVVLPGLEIWLVYLLIRKGQWIESALALVIAASSIVLGLVSSDSARRGGMLKLESMLHKIGLLRTLKESIYVREDRPLHPDRHALANYDDFFRTLIGRLVDVAKLSRESVFSDHRVVSIKIMLGSPISGHASSWFSERWKPHSMMAPVERLPGICELVETLLLIEDANANHLSERKLLCIEPRNLPKEFVSRLPWPRQQRELYTAIADEAYAWFSATGYGTRYLEAVPALMVLWKYGSGCQEMVTAVSNVEYFRVGASHAFRCPGLYTSDRRLIAVYEAFFDGLYRGSMSASTVRPGYRTLRGALPAGAKADPIGTWNRIATEWHALAGAVSFGFMEPLRDRLRSMLAGRDVSMVLDAGCGDGGLLDDMRDWLPRNVACYGVDASDAMVQIAQGAHPTARDRFSVVDIATDSEYRNAHADTFDLVTSTQVLMDISDVRSAIAWLALVLKKRTGILLVTVTHPWRVDAELQAVGVNPAQPSPHLVSFQYERGGAPVTFNAVNFRHTIEEYIQAFDSAHVAIDQMESIGEIEMDGAVLPSYLLIVAHRPD